MMHKGILAVVFYSLILSCGPDKKQQNVSESSKEKVEMVSAPGKSPMILLTDRPPNLETPLKYFLLDYTPNEVFFVRWHMSNFPPEISLDTFRLRIGGKVEHALELSVQDLKTKFKPVAITALAQCAGNSRSFFDPKVPGGQWKNGAMGNATWTGVRLSEILETAVLKKGALEISFNGMDDPPMPATPDFVKSLPLMKALDPDVIVAYEMNGKPLPLLNGYPLKLIVPGWYATYWVGMLNEITIHTDTFKGFWMKKAYLIPKNNRNANENHDSLAKDMEPISKMNVRSIFVSPEPDSVVVKGTLCEIQGLAFDGGDGISKVEIFDSGSGQWKVTSLDPVIGKYSWRRWRYKWTPASSGKYKFKVRATNVIGETQVDHHWNRSGYMRNEVEELCIIVR